MAGGKKIRCQHTLAFLPFFAFAPMAGAAELISSGFIDCLERVAGAADEVIARIHDGRMHAVPGLDDPSSRRYDVELERPHGQLAASSARMGVTVET